MNKIKSALTLVFALVSILVFAQPQPHTGPGEILQELKKLNVLGSTLYIAAHPDDENTRLIAWLANEKKLETAYLSLTRGDGGQNLIGPEIREELGIIRTQELLAARRTDGGNQFFTRANDFGYSKHPDETFTIWDREKVLADMVYVIRKWQPDVIITRFNTSPGTTHGHHTASAILAEEAMIAAADPKQFPEHINVTTQAWEVQRLFWNTSSWFFRGGEFDGSKYLKTNVGEYNQLLGESYSEIASRSRTMHKSQGFGSTGSRGDEFDYLSPIRGEILDMNSMFSGINQTWSRIDGGRPIGLLIEKAIADFNPEKPWEIVPTLTQAYAKLKALNVSFYKTQKLEQFENVIKACMGLYIDFTASTFRAAPGETMQVKAEMINRSPIKASAKVYYIKGTSLDGQINIELPKNEVRNLDLEYKVEQKMEISQPYWLIEEGTLGTYAIPSKKMTAKPENEPAMLAVLRVEIEGVNVDFESPVEFKKNDPVKGEFRRPFVFSPPMFVKLSDEVYLFT
ncbi:MAG: LmbE family N-acetylglucosaminyl deacetylase, partial [Sphingobacteriales bacterium]